MNEVKIREYLRSLGIPPHLSGLQAWCVALKYVMDSGDTQVKMMYLYNYVGKVMRKTPAAVERCLRHAIEYALNVTRTEKMIDLFEPFMSKDTGKVTNQLFLFTVFFELTKEVDSHD